MTTLTGKELDLDSIDAIFANGASVYGYCTGEHPKFPKTIWIEDSSTVMVDGVLIDMWGDMGMDIPANYENIVQ